MRVRSLSAAALLLVTTVACGGRGPASPTAPTTGQPAAAANGATIIGIVKNSGSSLLAASTGAAASSLTVTVVGTDISAVVGANGQFTLSGVPAGQVQLHFSGPGINATLMLSPVESTETVTLTLSIHGSGVEIESEGHTNHGDAELHGIVQNVQVNGDSFSFMLGTTLVQGDASTDFYGDGDHPDTPADLDNGDRVEVKGETRGDYVYAQRIHINEGTGTDDDDDEEDEVETQGTIESIGGTAPALILTLSTGQSIHTSSATKVRRRNQTLTLAVLAAGMEVEVEGTQNAGGWIDAKKIQIEDEADDDDDANEVEVKGVLGNLGGACPSITFTVNGTTQVQTNGGTKFKDAACSAFVNGVTVEVEGIKSGAVITAKKVKMED